MAGCSPAPHGELGTESLAGEGPLELLDPGVSRGGSGEQASWGTLGRSRGCTWKMARVSGWCWSDRAVVLGASRGPVMATLGTLLGRVY